MNILKKTWKAFTSLLAGCLGTGRSTGTPGRARPVSEAIRYRKRAKDAEQKLEAAAEALRQIDCLTFSTKYTYIVKVLKIRKLAQEAYRAAKE